jgi:hypothetical protein
MSDSNHTGNGNGRKPLDLSFKHREIIIADRKPRSKNTLVGFFSATLPSGLVLNNLMLHAKGEARWIGFPAREWTDQNGAKQFAKLTTFPERATADKFRDQLLTALDRHMGVSR